MPAEIFGVSEVRLHPNFRFTPQADRFDIAVVVLDRPAPYRENIRPICIPRKGADFLGRTAYAAGWGALEPGKCIICISMIGLLHCALCKVKIQVLRSSTLGWDFIQDFIQDLGETSDRRKIYWVTQKKRKKIVCF